MVRGNIIYQGESSKALQFFENAGFKCPQYSNPADFFMKMMNEEGLMIKHLEMGQVDFNDE